MRVALGLPAWLGEELDLAMAFAQCGCDTAEKAEQEPDKRLASALREKGADQQRTWGCPAAGHDGRAKLTPAHRLALGNVQRLTRLPAERCTTCPRWYARTSLAASACEGLQWAEWGEPRAAMKAALVWAISLLKGAQNARALHDAQKQRERMDALNKKNQPTRR